MNPKLQACIIDEQDSGENISLLLKSKFPEFKILFQTNSMEQAILHLAKNSPDLLFLNIQRINKDAIELFTKSGKKHTQVIFITDSGKSAIQAIKKGVADCLLKPVKNLDFIIAVNKAIENLKKNKFLFLNTPFQSKISLPTLQGLRRLDIDEIIRCEADSNYTYVHLSDQSKIIVSKTLHNFEKYLSGHNFFRIHRKHLINLSHLKEYIKGKGGQVIMTDNSVLDVSVRRKNDFLQKIA